MVVGEMALNQADEAKRYKLVSELRSEQKL
jgi:hypothetical protein